MNTIKEKVSYIRKEAKKKGLTFKKDKNRLFGDSSAYLFCNRKTGSIVIENCTIDSALMLILNFEI